MLYLMRSSGPLAPVGWLGVSLTMNPWPGCGLEGMEASIWVFMRANTSEASNPPLWPSRCSRRRRDVSRLQALGWSARTELRAGIKATYQWSLEDMAAIRT